MRCGRGLLNSRNVTRSIQPIQIKDRSKTKQIDFSEIQEIWKHIINGVQVNDQARESMSDDTCTSKNKSGDDIIICKTIGSKRLEEELRRENTCHPDVPCFKELKTCDTPNDTPEQKPLPSESIHIENLNSEHGDLKEIHFEILEHDKPFIAELLLCVSQLSSQASDDASQPQVGGIRQFQTSKANTDPCQSHKHINKTVVKKSTSSCNDRWSKSRLDNTGSISLCCPQPPVDSKPHQNLDVRTPNIILYDNQIKNDGLIPIPKGLCSMNKSSDIKKIPKTVIYDLKNLNAPSKSIAGQQIFWSTREKSTLDRDFVDSTVLSEMSSDFEQRESDQFQSKDRNIIFIEDVDDYSDEFFLPQEIELSDFEEIDFVSFILSSDSSSTISSDIPDLSEVHLNNVEHECIIDTLGDTCITENDTDETPIILNDDTMESIRELHQKDKANMAVQAELSSFRTQDENYVKLIQLLKQSISDAFNESINKVLEGFEQQTNASFPEEITRKPETSDVNNLDAIFEVSNVNKEPSTKYKETDNNSDSSATSNLSSSRNVECSYSNVQKSDDLFKNSLEFLNHSEIESAYSNNMTRQLTQTALESTETSSLRNMQDESEPRRIHVRVSQSDSFLKDYSTQHVHVSDSNQLSHVSSSDMYVCSNNKRKRELDQAFAFRKRRLSLTKMSNKGLRQKYHSSGTLTRSSSDGKYRDTYSDEYNAGGEHSKTGMFGYKNGNFVHKSNQTFDVVCDKDDLNKCILYGSEQSYIEFNATNSTTASENKAYDQAPYAKEPKCKRQHICSPMINTKYDSSSGYMGNILEESEISTNVSMKNGIGDLESILSKESNIQLKQIPKGENNQDVCRICKSKFESMLRSWTSDFFNSNTDHSFGRETNASSSNNYDIAPTEQVLEDERNLNTTTVCDQNKSRFCHEESEHQYGANRCGVCKQTKLRELHKKWMQFYSNDIASLDDENVSKFTDMLKYEANKTNKNSPKSVINQEKDYTQSKKYHFVNNDNCSKNRNKTCTQSCAYTRHPNKGEERRGFLSCPGSRAHSSQSKAPSLESKCNVTKSAEVDNLIDKLRDLLKGMIKSETSSNKVNLKNNLTNASSLTFSVESKYTDHKVHLLENSPKNMIETISPRKNSLIGGWLSLDTSPANSEMKKSYAIYQSEKSKLIKTTDENSDSSLSQTSSTTSCEYLCLSHNGNDSASHGTKQQRNISTNPVPSCQQSPHCNIRSVKDIIKRIESDNYERKSTSEERQRSVTVPKNATQRDTDQSQMHIMQSAEMEHFGHSREEVKADFDTQCQGEVTNVVQRYVCATNSVESPQRYSSYLAHQKSKEINSNSRQPQTELSRDANTTVADYSTDLVSSSKSANELNVKRLLNTTSSACCNNKSKHGLFGPTPQSVSPKYIAMSLSSVFDKARCTDNILEYKLYEVKKNRSAPHVSVKTTIPEEGLKCHNPGADTPLLNDATGNRNDSDTYPIKESGKFANIETNFGRYANQMKIEDNYDHISIKHTSEITDDRNHSTRFAINTSQSNESVNDSIDLQNSYALDIIGCGWGTQVEKTNSFSKIPSSRLSNMGKMKIIDGDINFWSPLSQSIKGISENRNDHKHGRCLLPSDYMVNGNDSDSTVRIDVTNVGMTAEASSLANISTMDKSFVIDNTNHKHISRNHCKNVRGRDSIDVENDNVYCVNETNDNQNKRREIRSTQNVDVLGSIELRTTPLKAGPSCCVDSRDDGAGSGGSPSPPSVCYNGESAGFEVTNRSCRVHKNESCSGLCSWNVSPLSSVKRLVSIQHNSNQSLCSDESNYSGFAKIQEKEEHVWNDIYKYDYNFDSPKEDDTSTYCVSLSTGVRSLDAESIQHDQNVSQLKLNSQINHGLNEALYSKTFLTQNEMVSTESQRESLPLKKDQQQHEKKTTKRYKEILTRVLSTKRITPREKQISELKSRSPVNQRLKCIPIDIQPLSPHCKSRKQETCTIYNRHGGQLQPARLPVAVDILHGSEDNKRNIQAQNQNTISQGIPVDIYTRPVFKESNRHQRVRKNKDTASQLRTLSISGPITLPTSVNGLCKVSDQFPTAPTQCPANHETKMFDTKLTHDTPRHVAQEKIGDWKSAVKNILPFSRKSSGKRK